jgi:hypothetical protein
VRDARDRAREGGEGEGRRRSRAAEQAEALEAQRVLFEDVRASLRSPVVPLLVRRLAAGYPTWFERAWRELRAVALSRGFETRADALRREAAREATATGAVAAGSYREALRQRALSTSVVDDIVRAVAVAHYVAPKTLLFAAALRRLLSGEATGAEPSAEDREAIPLGVPAELAEVPALGDAEAPGRVTRLWNDVVATLGLPGVTEELRVIGRWPDFLEVAWGAAKPLVGRPGVARLGALADGAARELALPAALGPASLAQLGVAPAQGEEMVRLVGEFREGFPPLAFTMALARLGLDESGAADVGASPFPV